MAEWRSSYLARLITLKSLVQFQPLQPWLKAYFQNNLIGRFGGYLLTSSRRALPSLQGRGQVQVLHWSPICSQLHREIMKAEFYQSKIWKRKRESILRRDGYQCRRCKRYGRQRPATTVHHIKHFDEFPELALDNENLISLCESCHNYYHPEKAEKSNKSRAKSTYL